MKARLTLATLGLATAAVLATSVGASACPSGYKLVNWQHSGNWICMLDASASNNLTANPGPSWHAKKYMAPRAGRYKRN
jgi:hypothetical protein